MSHKNTPGLGHSAIFATSILFQVMTNSETESTLQKFSKIWMEPPSGRLNLYRVSALIWKLWTTSFFFSLLTFFFFSWCLFPLLPDSSWENFFIGHVHLNSFPRALVLGNRLRTGPRERTDKSCGTGAHSTSFIFSASKLVLGFDLETAVRVLASTGWVHRLLRTTTLVAWLSPDIFSYSCNSCWSWGLPFHFSTYWVASATMYGVYIEWINTGYLPTLFCKNILTFKSLYWYILNLVANYLKLNKNHIWRGSHSFVRRYLKIVPICICIYISSSLKAAYFKTMSSRLDQPYVIFLPHMFIISTNKSILSVREINLNTLLFSLHHSSMKCRILLSSPFRDKEIKVSWLITQRKDRFEPRRSDARGWCLASELPTVWWCDMVGVNGIM